jgi:predicted small lipoprotein YifL
VLLTLSGSAAGTGDIEEYRVGDEVRFVLFWEPLACLYLTLSCTRTYTPNLSGSVAVSAPHIHTTHLPPSSLTLCPSLSFSPSSPPLSRESSLSLPPSLPPLSPSHLSLSVSPPPLCMYICIRPHFRLTSLFCTLNVRGQKGLYVLPEAETTAHDERKKEEKKRERDEHFHQSPSAGNMFTR